MSEESAKGSAGTCRLATADDRAAVAELFYLCDSHYRKEGAATREEMTAHIQEQVMAPGSNIEIMLAEDDDGTALGFASFAVLYPAPDLGGQLFLKDLFVSAEARGGGIGLTLLRALAGLALARGCVRLDWTAEDHNRGAIAFYDRIGARRVTEKIYYRFDGAALKDFAGDR